MAISLFYTGRNLFVSFLSFKFSKAWNLFEILICYCFQTSRSLSFPKLNLFVSNFCDVCILTAKLSVTFAITRQWSVSQSAPLKLRTSSILKCHLLSINTWPIWLWVFPSGEFQVCLWKFRCRNIVLWTTRFTDVARLNILTPLSIVSSCRPLFTVVGLKIFFLPTFVLKSPVLILHTRWFPTTNLYTPLLSPYVLHAPPISFFSIWLLVILGKEKLLLKISWIIIILYFLFSSRTARVC